MNDRSISAKGCRRNGTGVMSVQNPRLRCGWVDGGSMARDGPPAAARPGTGGGRMAARMTLLAGRMYPVRVIPAAARAQEHPAMQVLASNRTRAGRPSRIGMVTSLAVGMALVAASAVLLYLVFGDHFVDRFMPRGRATTYELVAGALAWTFALTAPAGFGLVGIARLVTAFDRYRARRPRVT